jgi:hypothetical protein
MNMRPTTSIEEEDAQLRLIQRELGKALRVSVNEVTCEPLPGKIALLLLRLALAQFLRTYVEQERDTDGGRTIHPSGNAGKVDHPSRLS